MESSVENKTPDHIDLFWKTSGKYYRLGQKVTTWINGGKEVFEVTGIREKELELKGDWSGGTAPDQIGWYPAFKCRPAGPELEWIQIK